MITWTTVSRVGLSKQIFSLHCYWGREIIFKVNIESKLCFQICLSLETSSTEISKMVKTIVSYIISLDYIVKTVTAANKALGKVINMVNTLCIGTLSIKYCPG